MAMFHLPFCLATLLPSAFAARDSTCTVTKTFSFKEDFFLSFHPLIHAIGPDNKGALMIALDSYSQSFKDAWIQEIETYLQDGNCKVDAMSLPEFDMCDWRHPDRYDVDELPTPGQSYVHADEFVQRLYFKVDALTITCKEDFSYDDLNKDAYTESAFAGDGFLSYISPPGIECDSSDAGCLFSTIETVRLDEFDSSNAELDIVRFTDIPLFLKCLDTDGYGPNIANKLIKALDGFFELYVEEELKKHILEQAPESSVFGFASPYASDRKYCAHGAYYTDGNLVSQVPDSDGILLTKFTYGFDVIWFKPNGFNEKLFPNLSTTIMDIFEDGSFLMFLQDKYPDYDFIQEDEVCNVIDPTEAELTLAPTQTSTDKPTSIFGIGEGPCGSNFQCASGLVCHEESSTCVCNVESNDGCFSGNICKSYTSNGIPKCHCNMDVDDGENGCNSGQVCRFSCAFIIEDPKCFDDEFVRDCESWWGDGYTCADGNSDGAIDILDKQSGCNMLPEFVNTSTPTESPTSIPTLVPTDKPTENPTSDPTRHPITESPTSSNEPTMFIEPTFNPTQSARPSFIPTKSPTFKTNQMPSESPIDEPTYIPTYGITIDLGAAKTKAPSAFSGRSLSPTSVILPAITASPTTASPIATPSPSATKLVCPVCIQHPNDTEEDECPIATSSTCGGGNRGDGICPFTGYCCSKWGFCGTTAEYCEDDSNVPTPSTIEAAPTAPTYSLDAGQCGGGDEGEGLCADKGSCCSEWGYCGPGENYCFITVRSDTPDDSDNIGTCGGGGVGNGKCRDGLCCSRFGFCGAGDEYCTGANEIDNITINDAEIIIDDSILPESLKPSFGFRCGVTEVDARSNCKSECTHHVQCESGEECWGVQLNYCKTFKEGTHPICTNLDLADSNNRCGFDEMSARGYCGPKCSSDIECDEGEFCFPTLLNLCECHEETEPEQSSIVFASAKALIRPYFIQGSEGSLETDAVEGMPRSASLELKTSVILATIGQISVAWVSYML